MHQGSAKQPRRKHLITKTVKQAQRKQPDSSTEEAQNTKQKEQEPSATKKRQ